MVFLQPIKMAKKLEVVYTVGRRWSWLYGVSEQNRAGLICVLAPTVVTVLLFAGLYLSCDRDITVGPLPRDGGRDVDTATSRDSVWFDSAVFVRPGGQGNGGPRGPLGSIQQAIDYAAASTGRNRVVIAIGTYYESLTITRPLLVMGGRNPDNGWAPYDGAYTIITGDSIGGEAIAVLIRDVESPVTFHNLVISAGDASRPGGGSYSMYVSQCDSVVLIDCAVRAGRGAHGAAGLDGRPGIDGVDGGSWPPMVGPCRGGLGGEGGAEGEPFEYNPGGPGEAGRCYFDELGGGLGGIPNSGDGGLGPDGEEGQSGVDGGTSLVAQWQGEVLVPSSASGAEGGEGTWGCGGGGGAGSENYCGHSTCVPGGWGGCGGSGGGPGSGGQGGHGGVVP